jgi:hypothetical protein
MRNFRTLLTAAVFLCVVQTAAIAQTLPAPWSSADVGAPALAGSASAASGTFTVDAAGVDIWDVRDQFHFVYRPLTGNGEIVVRLASVGNTDPWAKAGVMFREALTGGARHAMMATTPGNGAWFGRRPNPDAISVSTKDVNGTPPAWLRLVRTGDLFEGYRSVNGTTWIRVGSETIPMVATIYVGLAVTSHNATIRTRSTFDNVTVTGGSGNQSPAVTLTSPASGSQFTAPATVSLAATATDPENRMASVGFYVEGTLISTDTTAPYAASWSATTPGTYSLTARAQDLDGGSTTSSAVSVTVTGANQPPTVSLTAPASGATFTAPATINLTASGSDPEGPLARVEFFNGATLLGTDTSAPYAHTWSNVGAGSYGLRAVAYDSAGTSAASATVNVTVTAANNAPTVSLTSPASGATFTAPATINLAATAADSDGTVARVEFFNGAALLGSDTTSPYAFTWSNVPAGTYSVRAVAYDNASASASSTTATVTVQTGTAGLPDGQVAADIGSPAVAGSTTFSSGAYTVRAGGTDIWGASDQFHFVYRPVTGNTQIVAHIVSIGNTDPWAKAGIMIREALTPGSRHAMMAATPSNGTWMGRRLQPGAASVSSKDTAGTSSAWLRLVRTGNLIEGFWSTNGATWTLVGSETIAMTATVYVGMAATSHNPGTATTVMVDNLAVTTPSGNQPPTASLTSPATGATFTAPATINLTASASDPEGQLTRVEFFSGTTLLNTDTTAPYAFTWSNVAAGTYSLRAVAYDTAGASGSSATVSVTVTGSSTPPTGIVFAASADHSTNVTNYLLKVFPQGANPDTATPTATSDLGKPTPAGNNDITVDRASFFASLPSGSYIATVTAIGPGGQTRSASVSFVR